MTKALDFSTAQRKVNDLLPLSINPRKISEAKLAKLIDSLSKFNLVDLPVIDFDNTLISGHQRMKALQAMGRGEDVIDVRIANRKMTQSEVKQYNLLANTHFGEFDFDALEESFTDIDFGDLGLDDLKMDFEKFVLGDLDNPDVTESDNSKSTPPQYEAVEDDFESPVEPEKIETDIVLGDLFEIGKHRLLCGDSTDKENVKLLLGGGIADMMFTDPPYDMTMGGQGCFAKTTANLKERIQDIIHFDPYVIAYLPELDVRTFYICTSKDAIPKYLDIFKGYNFNILVWCKTNPTPFTSGTFLPDIEYIMFFSRKGDKIWNNSLSPMNIYTKYYISNKLEGRTDGGGDLHPTMKPINLIANKILISSNETDGIVLDVFLGSGSTMVAAHQTNRKCYGIELSPNYCQVIVDRMRKLDPTLIIKKNGIEI